VHHGFITVIYMVRTLLIHTVLASTYDRDTTNYETIGKILHSSGAVYYFTNFYLLFY